MKFYRYITENKTDFNKIENDGKPFLDDLRKIKKPPSLLYSGRKSSEDFISRKVRKNRKPKNTPERIHNWLDKWFEYKFGIKARSKSLMADNKKAIASTYGTPYIIFPVGKYKIIWSEEVPDLYDDIKLQVPKEEIEEVLDKEPREVENLDNSLIEILETYKENNLKKALSIGETSFEIMLICDHYYGINTNSIDKDELIEWFNSLEIYPEL